MSASESVSGPPVPPLPPVSPSGTSSETPSGRKLDQTFVIDPVLGGWRISSEDSIKRNDGWFTRGKFRNISFTNGKTTQSVTIDDLADVPKTELLEKYCEEFEKWAQEASTETVKYVIKSREKLTWTSEVFDFSLYVHNTTVDEDCQTLTKLYLFDLFSAPRCSGHFDVDYYLSHPRIIEVLRDKLFTLADNGNGVVLKEKYAASSMFKPSLNQDVPVPINNDMVKAMQRDCFFNTNLRCVEKVSDIPLEMGSFQSLPVVYRALGVNALEKNSVSDLMKNLVSNDTFTFAPQLGQIGPSYGDTLLNWIDRKWGLESLNF